MAGPLVDFPVLIQIATDGDLAASARTDGFDLAFSADDGITRLDHELERYVGSTGELVAWVRVPSLDAATDVTLYLYFGRPDATDQQRRAAVWDSSFRGVWHLADPAGTTIVDSTANAALGTRTSPTTPAPGAGRIGAGQVFRGAADGIDLGGSPSLDVPMLTFETWIQVGVTPGDIYKRIFDLPAGFTNSWVLSYPSTGAPLVNQRSLVVDLPGDVYRQTPVDSFPPNIWHHVVLQTNPLTVWIDGLGQTLTTAPYGLVQDANVAMIGNRQGSPDRAVDGPMDEVRISDVRRSSAWIVTTYNNQRLGGAFVSIGAVEAVP